MYNIVVNYIDVDIKHAAELKINICLFDQFSWSHFDFSMICLIIQYIVYA
jgi:hypothetical protein